MQANSYVETVNFMLEAKEVKSVSNSRLDFNSFVDEEIGHLNFTRKGVNFGIYKIKFYYSA